jgi:arylsulfatase A-like enzyme
MKSSPNVLFIVTDDHGRADLSCLGSPDIKTPHLDQIAERGVLCETFYSNSPVCSPSRAALLTGRYPGNAGVRSILAGHRTAKGLPATTPTISSILSAKGYLTFLSGKWHLGLAPGSRPQDHGFQRSFGCLAGCVDFFSHIFYWSMNRGTPCNDPIHDLWEDGKEIWKNGQYLTEVITEKALGYVRDACDQQKPFFGYIAYNAPHYPMHAPTKYLDRFPELPPDRRIMAAMLSAVDDGVGEIVSLLRSRNQLDNTIIVFLSDNGPSRETRNWLDGNTEPYYGGSAGPLRGHKFSLFEGGIRVPGIISWPNGIPAGQRLTEPVASMDILPTVLAACGEDVTEQEFDGVNILPRLQNEGSLPERAIYWEQGSQTAVRRGCWKLVLNGQVVEQESPIAESFLSNLEEDPGETQNLCDENAGVAMDLKKAALQWREGIEERWLSQHLPQQTGITALS